jgi:hypothetical protein
MPSRSSRARKPIKPAVSASPEKHDGSAGPAGATRPARRDVKRGTPQARKAKAEPPIFARKQPAGTAIKDSLRAMDGAELIALVGEVMSLQAAWKHLRPAVQGVMRAAQLAPQIEAALVEPRISLQRLGDDLVARARIAGEAKLALIAEEEMLSGAEVSTLLGSRSENKRQYANRLRAERELLAVQRANQYAYPAFQIDRVRKRVYPEVKLVGRLLDAADDPWGVLSWWQSPNPRIGDRRPRDLLGTAEAGQLRSLAEAVIEPVG